MLAAPSASARLPLFLSSAAIISRQPGRQYYFRQKPPRSRCCLPPCIASSIYDLPNLPKSRVISAPVVKMHNKARRPSRCQGRPRSRQNRLPHRTLQLHQPAQIPVHIHASHRTAIGQPEMQLHPAMRRAGVVAPHLLGKTACNCDARKALTTTMRSWTLAYFQLARTYKLGTTSPNTAHSLIEAPSHAQQGHRTQTEH